MGPTTLIDKSLLRLGKFYRQLGALINFRQMPSHAFDVKIFVLSKAACLRDARGASTVTRELCPVLVIIFSLRGNLYFYTKWFLIVYYLYIHAGLDYKTRLSYESRVQRPASPIL